MKTLLASLVVICIATLAACGNYAVTFNERPVYTPPPLLTDYQVADPRLETCLAQTIADQRITSAGALQRLSCSYAGIRSLEGIARFSQLRLLDLSDNQLTDLSALSTLSQLAHVDVSHNNLTSAAALLSLLRLQYLNIDHNPDLPCGDLRQLAAGFSGKLILPQQCR